jgi:hypothetical protein
MPEHTSLKLLTSCGLQGYRSRGQDVVAAPAANGVKTARFGYAVATPSSSGREDHAQDRQGSAQVDHHKARDADTVVRDSDGCQHRRAVWNVDRQSLPSLPLSCSAHYLRNLVRSGLPASSQTSPQDRDHHSPHPDSPSSEVSDPLTHLTLQKLLTRCRVTRNVLSVSHTTRKGSER